LDFTTQVCNPLIWEEFPWPVTSVTGVTGKNIKLELKSHSWVLTYYLSWAGKPRVVVLPVLAVLARDCVERVTEMALPVLNS